MRDVALCWISCSESLQLFWTVNNLKNKKKSGLCQTIEQKIMLQYYLTDD